MLAIMIHPNVLDQMSVHNINPNVNRYIVLTVFHEHMMIVVVLDVNVKIRAEVLYVQTIQDVPLILNKIQIWEQLLEPFVAKVYTATRRSLIKLIL